MIAALGFGRAPARAITIAVDEALRFRALQPTARAAFIGAFGIAG